MRKTFVRWGLGGGWRRRPWLATGRGSSGFFGFVRFNEAWRKPAEIFAGDVEAFLTHLARDRRLSLSSQNQACNAIVLLYKHALVDELPADHLGRFVAERSKRPVRVPTVLSVNELSRLIESRRKSSLDRLMCELLYGTGLRVMEYCTLRVRDIDFDDFDRDHIIVRSGKGDKDRLVMLPATLRGRLAARVPRVRQRHNRDLHAGGYDIRQVQTLLGHASVKTTMICTHVRPNIAVLGPLDRLIARPCGNLVVA